MFHRAVGAEGRYLSAGRDEGDFQCHRAMNGVRPRGLYLLEGRGRVRRLRLNQQMEGRA